MEQMDVDEPMSSHLQDDILMDILKRLPVRSLLRFKCVSKSWETFISDPYFKMTHLNHAKDNQNSQKFLISLCFPKDGESIVLLGAQLSQNPSSRLGLDYDPTSGDCKILKIQPYIDSPGEILTLRSGSWRNIDEHPRGIRGHNDGMHYLPFVNEAFHWIGIFGNYSMASRNYSVVSFSISNEVYGDIPLPEQLLCLRGYISIGVSVLEGLRMVNCYIGAQVLEAKGMHLGRAIDHLDYGLDVMPFKLESLLQKV